MPRQYLTKPARLLKRTGNHVRIDLGDEEELRLLGRSYLARPIYPIIVTPEWEIGDGNRRHAGVMLENPDAEVPVCVTDEAVTPASLLEIQVESAAHTRGLSDYELFTAYSEWLALHAGATAKELAARFRRDEGVLSKILSLSRGIDEVREAAKARLLTYAKWWPICKLPPEQQATALADALKGATRDELQARSRRSGRGQPNDQADNKKVPAIRITLPGELVVTIKGPELNLAKSQEALKAAAREVEFAKSQNLNARTAQAAWKDRATPKPAQPATQGETAAATAGGAV